MLALEAQGCDAEDAVVALANLISDQTHGSEEQNGLAAGSSLRLRPTQGSPWESRSTKSPVSRGATAPGNAGPGGIRGGGCPRLDQVSIVVLQPEGGGFGEEATVEVDREGTWL